MFAATASSRAILEKSMTMDRRMFMFYVTPTTCTGCLYVITPLIQGNYKTWKYGNATWEMPMKSL